MIHNVIITHIYPPKGDKLQGADIYGIIIVNRLSTVKLSTLLRRILEMIYCRMNTATAHGLYYVPCAEMQSCDRLFIVEYERRIYRKVSPALY